MSNVSEEQRWAVGDIKDFLNVKYENLVFLVGEYIRRNRFVYAFRTLMVLMRLLPREVKKDERVKPYRRKMEAIKNKIRSKAKNEPYKFYKISVERRIINQNADFLEDAVEAVQDALIDWHIRSGYTGVPMKDDVEKPDFEIGEDED